MTSLDKWHGSVFAPNNRHMHLRCVLIVLLTIAPLIPAQAQAPGQQALLNIELEYTYHELGTVVLKIGDGKLGYTWTEGPGAGNAVTGKIYQSRKIAEDIYLVTWNDSENSDYVVLVIDLGEMLVHGSALSAYRSQDAFAFFGKAKIARVER